MKCLVVAIDDWLIDKLLFGILSDYPYYIQVRKPRPKCTILIHIIGGCYLTAEFGPQFETMYSIMFTLKEDKIHMFYKSVEFINFTLINHCVYKNTIHCIDEFPTIQCSRINQKL